VQNAGVAARREVGHVAANVPDDANAEIRSPGRHLAAHRARGQAERDLALDE
jgi:hypothetical protein